VSDPETSQQADQSIQLLVWASPQAGSPILLIPPCELTRIGVLRGTEPSEGKTCEFDAMVIHDVAAWQTRLSAVLRLRTMA
jgi:hypothetical protein